MSILPESLLAWYYWWLYPVLSLTGALLLTAPDVCKLQQGMPLPRVTNSHLPTHPPCSTCAAGGK